MAEPAPFLYRQLADMLAGQIRQGLLAPGERLPSVRALCEAHAVSLSTAVQTYLSLEQEGWVEARPRAGYFVRVRPRGAECEPAMSRPQMVAREIAVAHLALDVVKEARRPGVVNLGAAWADPRLLPLKALAREHAELARHKPELLGVYEISAGYPELRRQVARHLQRAGCRCAPDEIIITNGCMEALALSLRAVAKSGDTIAIESPTFYGVLQAIEAAGMKALELPTHPRDGVDLDSLEQALKRRRLAACLLIPSFNNPLGSCIPLAHRERLARLLASADVPLIEDDVFGDISFQWPRLPAVKSFDRAGNVLLCSSFSKTLGPGCRLGYVAAGRYADRVEHGKLLANIATAGLPQAALANYLARGTYDRVAHRASRAYYRRSEQLRHWLLECMPAGTRVTQPQGGVVLWVELPSHVDGVALHDAALQQQLSITPGVIFSPHADYRHHLRISYGLVDDAEMQGAVRKLGVLAHDLASRRSS
jgi:DNA-binding transcriptional MocR family regulator